MTEPSSPRPVRRLILGLGGILLATFLLISWLILVPHATVVELTLSVTTADFVVVPENPSAAARLFASPLALRYLALKGVSKVETTLEGEGRVTLQPADDGQIRLEAPESFLVDLSLERPTRLILKPTPGGGNQLQVSLAKPSKTIPSGKGVAEAAPPEGWQWVAAIEPFSVMALSVEDVAVIRDGAPPSEPVTRQRYTVPDDVTQLVVTSGREESNITLSLEPGRKPATRLRVLDPATGEISEAKRLEQYVIAEPRSLEWQGRLILLDPDRGDEPVQPLREDLRVRDVGLWQGRETDHGVKSFLEGGQVRFLEGKREPLKLDPNFFMSLELEADHFLTLRSLKRVNDNLELVLRGKVRRLTLGPTVELRNNVLPSRFEWLYTHQLAVLVYGALAGVVGSSLALFKVLGLLGK